MYLLAKPFNYVYIYPSNSSNCIEIADIDCAKKTKQ